MIFAALALLAASPPADRLAERMQQRWSPACDTIERVTDLTAIVRLDVKGFVKGDIVIVDRRTGLTVDPAKPEAASPGAIPAAERAKKAIVGGQPYGNLPPNLAGEAIRVDFNAQSACS